MHPHFNNWDHQLSSLPLETINERANRHTQIFSAQHIAQNKILFNGHWLISYADVREKILQRMLHTSKSGYVNVGKNSFITVYMFLVGWLEVHYKLMIFLIVLLFVRCGSIICFLFVVYCRFIINLLGASRWFNCRFSTSLLYVSCWFILGLLRVCYMFCIGLVEV